MKGPEQSTRDKTLPGWSAQDRVIFHTQAKEKNVKSYFALPYIFFNKKNKKSIIYILYNYKAHFLPVFLTISIYRLLQYSFFIKIIIHFYITVIRIYLETTLKTMRIILFFYFLSWSIMVKIIWCRTCFYTWFHYLLDCLHWFY